MKSILLVLLSILFGGAVTVFAGDKTTETEAALVARNFYFERINQLEVTAWQDIRILGTDLIEKDGTGLYYAVNLQDGFVLVAADKNVFPVLAYAFEGSFDKPRKQENVAAWLGQYERQIAHATETDAPAFPESAIAWKKYLDEDFTAKSIENFRIVEPMLVSNWDQGTYYNGQCPADPSGVGGHCVTGCVATALGQLVYYFRFPQSGTGSYSYEHPDYGTISANFGEADYDYNQMMNALNAPNPEVAELLFHLGVACDMVYGPQSSGMYNHKAAYALRTFFKYSPETQYVYRDSTGMDWDSLLVTHLDQNIPMYYAGWSVPDINGHAFIVDGYQGDNFYHFNWGWGGSYDGYFYTGELTPGGNNFNLAQELIIHAFPDTTNYTYPDYCSGSKNFDFMGGTFTDGSFPVYDYQDNADCQWLIDPQNEQDSVTNITLSFQRFHLDGSSDFVNVYDGDNTSAPMLASLVGNALPDPIVSTGNKMLVTFTSDGQGNGPGFFASFESNQPTWCSGTTVMLEQQDEFSDGSHSFFYNNNSTCMWQIMPLNAGEVSVYFTSFDTEQGEDHVKIYDSQTMELLADYSGYYPPDNLPPPVTSESGKIFFLFHSDEAGRAPGWEAVYYSDLVSVDENHQNQGVQVFPNPAANTLNIRFRWPGAAPLKLTLINHTGQTVKEHSFTQTQNGLITMDISGLSPGIYFLKCGVADTQIIKKVVISNAN
jgi:hypothetical protein